MNPKFRRKFSSPLILKYLSEFEKNPQSRIFAQLAEAYRKIGMADEALEILKKGIKAHPNYEMAYYCLGMCYFDLGKFELCHKTLEPLARKNYDNLALQRTFGEVSEKLGRNDEALTSYKYVLYANPRNEWAKEKVRKLETMEGDVPSASIMLPPTENFALRGRSLDDDQWEEMGLEPKESGPVLDEGPGFKSGPNPEAMSAKSWEGFEEISIIPPPPKQLLDMELAKPAEASLQEDPSSLGPNLLEAGEVGSQEADKNYDHEVEVRQVGSSSPPLITHTLVDLYCAQGHFLKAREILEKILELNPNDIRTSQRIRELKEMVFSVPIGNAPKAANPIQEVNLSQVNRVKMIESKYNSFLNRLKNKAKIHLSTFTLPTS